MTETRCCWFCNTSDDRSELLSCKESETITHESCLKEVIATNPTFPEANIMGKQFGFVTEEEYRKRVDVWMNDQLLSRTTSLSVGGR